MGSSGQKVKQRVNKSTMVGGGCKDQLMGCGTHWVNHNGPPKWGGEQWSAETGQFPCPAVHFQGQFGPSKNFTKL